MAETKTDNRHQWRCETDTLLVDLNEGVPQLVPAPTGAIYELPTGVKRVALICMRAGEGTEIKEQFACDQSSTSVQVVWDGALVRLICSHEEVQQQEQKPAIEDESKMKNKIPDTESPSGATENTDDNQN